MKLLLQKTLTLVIKDDDSDSDDLSKLCIEVVFVTEKSIKVSAGIPQSYCTQTSVFFHSMFAGLVI